MTKSISVYETNLNRRRERYAKRNVLPGHIVYLLGKRGVDSFKIGRTSDFSARIAAYQSYLGPDISALVQIELPTRADAVVLEREFIKALGCAEARRGREWFKMPYPALAALLKDVLGKTSTSILKIRGAPGLRHETTSELVIEVSRIFRDIVTRNGAYAPRDWNF